MTKNLPSQQDVTQVIRSILGELLSFGWKTQRKKGHSHALMLSTASAVFSLAQEHNTMEISINADLSPKSSPWKSDNSKHFILADFSTYQQTAKVDRQGFCKWKASRP